MRFCTIPIAFINKCRCFRCEVKVKTIAYIFSKIIDIVKKIFELNVAQDTYS